MHACAQHHPHTPDCVPYRTACPHTHTHAHTHTGQPFLTSMTPWWMEVYCFFLSITKVMTITVAMTTPPTIRPIMAPLLEPTSSAKKTCGRRGTDSGRPTCQSHALDQSQPAGWFYYMESRNAAAWSFLDTVSFFISLKCWVMSAVFSPAGQRASLAWKYFACHVSRPSELQ